MYNLVFLSYHSDSAIADDDDDFRGHRKFNMGKDK